MTEARTVARVIAGLATIGAVGVLGWGVFRVARAQLALPNLVPHLNGLVLLALVAIVVATISAALGHRPVPVPVPVPVPDAPDALPVPAPVPDAPDVPAAPAPSVPAAPAPAAPRAAPRAARTGDRVVADGANPVALTGRVHLLGAAPTSHVRIPLPGTPPLAARIERRGGTLHLVPEDDVPVRFSVGHEGVEGPRELRVGDVITVRVAGLAWTVRIEEART